MPSDVSIQFTGVQNAVGGSLVFSRGISPGICVLKTIPQPILLSQVGTLVIEYQNEKIILPSCAVNSHTLRLDQHPHQTGMKRSSPRVWQIQIMDRRWAWRYKKISGEYNVRLPNCSVRSSNNHPELKRSLYDLASLCMSAMGEINFDISALPRNVYPYVNWQNANPSSELQALCDLVSCVIVYDWKYDRVVVHRIGIGQSLPENPSQKNPSLKVSVSRRPDVLRVECWPTRYQLKFELEAVGLDTDGSIKKIDDLSYKPSGGWKNDWWCAFPNVNADNRHLAYKTVFRWYRIKAVGTTGGLSVPGVGEPIRSVDQFELEDVLLETGPDFDGMSQTQRGVVNGEFWPQSPFEATTTESTKYGSSGWKILPDHKNIVEFEYPVLKVQNGEYEPAKLYVTATCKVRKENGGWYVAQSYERSLPWLPSGAGARVLKHPELWAVANQSPVNGGSWNTNSDTAFEASTYLDYVYQEYLSSPAEDFSYAGILPIGLDGAIAQVKWSLGVNSAATTRASLNHEFDMFTPSYEWRRRYERVDSLADREMLQ